MDALITLLLFFVGFGPPAPEPVPDLPVPYCDARGEKARPYTEYEKMETRHRVQAVCEYVKADPIVCAYLDVIVVRESSGRAGVRHTIGKNENGLGSMSLSLRWHADKWPGDDEDPMFCHPEVSALVTLEIIDRAFRKYAAENILDVQGIFGGSWECWQNPETGERMCRANPRHGDKLCERMASRGYDCGKFIDRSSRGTYIRKRDRRKVAAMLYHAYQRKNGQ